MFRLFGKMTDQFTNDWLTPQSIQQLNDCLSVSSPELKHFLSTQRPDIVTAIERTDRNVLKNFTNQLRVENPFVKINSLDEFLIFLKRSYFEFINRMDKYSQKLSCSILPFIDCALNGHQMVGLIDTGAQHSIISTKLAQKCLILHLIDQRYETKAIGVGEQIVIGKIHSTNIEMNGIEMDISFMVVQEFHSEYFLIGNNFLIQHKCVVYCSDGSVFFKDLRLLVKTKSSFI